MKEPNKINSELIPYNKYCLCSLIQFIQIIEEHLFKEMTEPLKKM